MKTTRWPKVHLALTVLGDLVIINGTSAAISYFKFDALIPHQGMIREYISFNILINVVFLSANLLCGAYRDTCRAPLGHQTATVMKACVWASLFSGAAVFILLHHWGFSRLFVGFVLISISTLLPLYRILLYGLNLSMLNRGIGLKRSVLIGEPKTVYPILIRAKLAAHLGYSIEGVAANDWSMAGGLSEYGPPVLTSCDEMRTLIRQKGVDHILVLSDRFQERDHKDILGVAREEGTNVRLLPTPSLIPDLRTRIHDLFGFSLISHSPPRFTPSARLLKRSFDLVGSLLALAFLSPLFAAIAVAIKLDSKGPVFYRQSRLGLGGRPFKMLKFRSMKNEAEKELDRLNHLNETTGPIFKIRKDPRVTRVGRLLRKFSLDELPQLINVFVGDLSLVGPRPPLPAEVAHYEDWQKKRLDMPQGITGLWQVSGRSRLTFEEMILTDLYYVENWSFLLDFEILMETLPTILHGDGAY